MLRDILNLVYSIICSIFFYIPVVINNIDQISIIECQEAKDLKEMMILIVLHAGRLLVLLRQMALQHHWIRMLFVTWLNNSIFANIISRASWKKNYVIFLYLYSIFHFSVFLHRRVYSSCFVCCNFKCILQTMYAD